MAGWLAVVTVMILLIMLANLISVLLAVAGGIASLFVARLTEPIVRGAPFGHDAGWTFSLADTRLLLAAVSIGLPLDGGSFSARVSVPGRDSIPTLPGGGPHVSTITPGYFETVGPRLLYGRAFNERDREGSEPVIIINETMAGAIWNGRDALDQCVHIGNLTNPCARIVGIVEDVHRIGLREQPSLQYYLPLGQQNMFGGAKLVIRTSSSASLSLAALRKAIVQADPGIRAVDIQPLSASLDGELRPLRLATFGGRWLQPHLFDTSAHDAGVISGVAAALLLTAIVAGWIPARRATHISPTQALRAE